MSQALCITHTQTFSAAVETQARELLIETNVSMYFLLPVLHCVTPAASRTRLRRSRTVRLHGGGGGRRIESIFGNLMKFKRLVLATLIPIRKEKLCTRGWGIIKRTVGLKWKLQEALAPL